MVIVQSIDTDQAYSTMVESDGIGQGSLSFTDDDEMAKVFSLGQCLIRLNLSLN
jgi:hypothetical protein